MKIFCSGIGGIGLSAYAGLQQSHGHEVLGSDRASSIVTDDLIDLGVSVSFNQDGSAIPDDIDLFVYSEAVPEDSPERVRATELGVVQKTYFQALGDISRDFNVIAVCGTHGKSSTTAMASKVLTEAGLDPNVIVGTRLKELGGRNWRAGESNLFLLEACEYRCSFHSLSPNIILMTNCDGDHFDAFDSVEQYQEGYVKFLQMLPEDGVVLTHMSDEDCRSVVGRRASEIGPVYAVATAGKRRVVDVDEFPLISMKTPGRHMQENAQLVLGLSAELGIERDQAEASLRDYEGSWRRIEVKGETDDGVLVIDDYGHHPREIQATLRAIKERYSDQRLVCVFQPHMHDRTIKLYGDFLKSYSDTDVLILTDVYDARAHVETDRVDMEKFTADIAATGVDAVYAGDLEQSEKHLRDEVLHSGDVLVCMGAGTITDLATTVSTS